MAYPPGDDMLKRLPVELLTETLTYLPAKEIARFRRVDKGCAAVVDDNADALALPHLHYHRRRLQNRLDYLLDPQLHIRDAFVHWVAYHGTDLASVRRSQANLRHAVTQFIQAFYGVPSRRYQDIFDQTYQTKIQGLVAFVNHPPPRFFSGLLILPPRHPIDRIATLLSEPGEGPQNFSATRSKVRTYVEDSDLFRGPYHAANVRSPQLRLTTHNTADASGRPKWTSGICNDIGTVLDLPKSRALDMGAMTYCVKSVSIVSVAREAARPGARENLSPIKKAALISEIFLW